MVLREVGETVAEVIISADGSWKAVLESDDHVDQGRDNTLKWQKENETEDRKPLLASFPVTSNLTLPPVSNTTNGVNQNVPAQIEDEFWSEVLGYDSINSTARSNAQRVGDISEPIPANLMQSPVLTDAVSTALNQEAEGRGGNSNFTTSLIQTQSSPYNFQLQHLQYATSMSNNEYGRSPSIPRHVSRTPIAVQALPAQSQAPNLLEIRSSLNSLTPNGSLNSSQVALNMAPTADAFNTICSDMERQQHFRAHMNPLQVSDIPSSSLLRPSVTQNWDHQDRSHISSQSVQPGLGRTALCRLQMQSAYRASSGLLTDFENPHLQQAFNPRMPQPVGQSSSNIQPSPHLSRNLSQQSPHLSRNHIQQGGGQIGINHRAGTSGSQQAKYVVGQRVAVQMGRQAPSVPVLNQTSRTGHSLPLSADGLRASTGEQRGNMGGMSQAVPRPDGLLDSSSEQNWQPTGRMRGSLSGRAYNDALNQFMIRPTQTPQTARPPPNPTPPASSVSPQLHALLANSRNARSPQTPNIQ
uniref:Uncharacterized protein n=1 Tax=Fagus sylvatica TaxID=28930 RepID=A0A2N9GKW1_FAGSY